ncbi:MAG TPA: arginine--tRNA ligase [Fimbriimonadales bacterium]|nr:arginine--tRNA ligase [Fimbriimonadales bacterium]
MIRKDLETRLKQAVTRLISEKRLPDGDYSVEISEPAQPEFGDFATNFALSASRIAKKPPQEIAETLVSEVQKDPEIASATVAGPGFINLRLTDAYFAKWGAKAYETEEGIGRIQKEHPKKILVEYVSVNPNGPIHCGHGRGAAYGETLCRVLEAYGEKVSREFYVNDSTNSLQMQLFALSVKARYCELLGLPAEFPKEGYRGEYVDDLAKKIRQLYGDDKAKEGLEFWQPVSQNLMLEQQKKDLEDFGVKFDTWFSEQQLYDSGEVDRAIELLKQRGYAYEKEGALWLKSTAFGDDKDRVLVRADGQKTYIASDVAYHKNKFDRGFDHLINVWGADHHGYIARTKAAVQALGYCADRLEIIITQMVRFLKDGLIVPMSKRSGDLVPLRELIENVGVDVARFFYLMRSHDAHMDFDLDLAAEHSERNPVYYVQYAHARICSVLAKAREAGFAPDPKALKELTHEAERKLVKRIWDLPYEIERCVQDRGVHRLTTYALELARDYHNFYDKCRVINPSDLDTTKARLALCVATRHALRATFHLLGISAPEKM